MERERVGGQTCVCVLRAREREGERGGQTCVCVCVARTREREGESLHARTD